MANTTHENPKLPSARPSGSELDALSRTVTTLCQAIDPTSLHGPETEKIAAHARATRFAVRMLFEAVKEYAAPGAPLMTLENLKRLEVLDALNEPVPDCPALLLDNRTFPNDRGQARA